jgi:acyl CoA:acetate/3-ketoacid CoA transferase beta subunit
VAAMGKFLHCGLIVAFVILSPRLVCAESPSGEPVFARANNSALDMSDIRQLMKDNPQTIDRIKALIEQNPQLVASIAKDSTKLIQEIQNYPQLAETIIDANPQLVQALMNNPQSRSILMR